VAEAVDRLLRIADQQQQAACGAVAAAIQGVEDRPLPRIGVLEFVDQCDRPLRMQAIGE
jgi:hypothetical protein